MCFVRSSYAVFLLELLSTTFAFFMGTKTARCKWTLTHALFFSYSQRTSSQLVSPTLTWALNSKWWSAPGRPPCSVLPAAIRTRKSPGTRTSCPLTPVQVVGGSNSCAQVREAQASPVFCWLQRLSLLLFENPQDASGKVNVFVTRNKCCCTVSSILRLVQCGHCVWCYNDLLLHF